MSTRTTNTIRNIVAGLISRLVHILSPFAIRTIMIRVLGKEYLGLNTLFTSIFTFLVLAEFGFANAMTFKMYRPAKEEDFTALSVYASVIRRVYWVVGMVIFCIGMFLMPFLPYLINGEYPSDVNIYILYFIYLFNTVIPYFGCGYCTSIFTAFQRMDISQMVNAAVILTLYLVQIIVLLTTREYYLYIICLPVFTLCYNLLLWAIKRKYYPKILTNIRVDGNIVKEAFSSASVIFGHSLNYVVVSMADNMVISSFLGLGMLAVYGNYYAILSAVVCLLDIVIQACVPSVGNLLLEGDRVRIKSIFKSICFLGYWLSGWCAICLICLYQPFMELWMGGNMLLPFSTVILFGIYLYTYKSREGFIVFKDAAGIWKDDWPRPYVSATVNLILNIFLVKRIGINGVLLSTIAVFCFIDFLWGSRVMLKKILPDYKKSYYFEYVKYLLINFTVALFTYAICNLWGKEPGYKTFFVRATICVVVPNAMFVILYHKDEEYESLKEMIKKMLNRRRRKKF